MNYTKDEILKKLEQENIQFIHLWFVDIIGLVKCVELTRRNIEEAIDNGVFFDGSSIEGFTRINESDMLIKPDLSTFVVIPWLENKTARFICDVLLPDGTPYEGDARYILKKNLEEAKSLGFEMFVGPELEYFYFKSAKHPEVLDEYGYFELSPNDLYDLLRNKTVLELEKMGIEVGLSHHEVAPSQHEIQLHYNKALKMADNAITYKVVVKELALEKGCYASFMPKPIMGENGSGMHTNMSLFKDNNNAFYDKNDEHGLSKIGKSYIAGILKYVKEFTMITNPSINSYKRLVPGYEAPVYISWAKQNRSTLVRIPRVSPDKAEKATRIELRSPDPTSNPYLAFSVMLAAGLQGIKENLELSPAIEDNIFAMDNEERKKRKIDALPSNLYEAMEYFENSELMKKCLGNEMFTKLLNNRRAEWKKYEMHVSDFEMKHYFPIL
jgi:glutamine synthetase